MTYKTLRPEPDLCNPCVDLYGYDAVRRATVDSVDPARSKPARHAAPWTFRRALADLFTASRVRAVRAPADLLSGREAVARALFAEQVRHSIMDLADYDSSPMLQGAWLAVADRRIAHAKSQDRHVAAFHGIKDADWIHLPSLVQRDHREAFYQAKGL